MKLQFNKQLNMEIVVFDHEGRQFSVPRRLNNRYEVYDVLAAGGMGIIFIAKDLELSNKKVLIKRCLHSPSLFQYANDKSRQMTIETTRKIMNTEYAAMLHGWARKIPNIPIPIDFFEDINPEIYGPHNDKNGKAFVGEKELYEKEPYIVINYFTGRPIKSDNPQLAKNIIGFAKFYIGTISNILKRFHRPYISDDKIFEFFYCDLKPDNVLLTDDGQLVLIDMGSFAIRLNGQLAGQITTTPGYCAPELKNNQAMHLSPCVDVYTLAVSIFELITEQPPKLDQYGNSVLNWGSFERIVNSSNQTYLINVFKKALEDDPGKRFKTMQDFSDAINNLNRKKFTSNSKSFAQKNMCYLKKNLNRPVQITHEWQSQQGSIDFVQQKQGSIVNFPVWKKENLFDLQGNASKINSKNKFNSIAQSLLQDLFNKAKNNLISNLTFCPELLNITSQKVYLNYIPGLQMSDNKSGKERDLQWRVKKYLEKIIYLFMKLEQMQYRIVGLSPTTICSDTLFNPFILEFWLLFNPGMHNFIENPLIKDIVGKNVILPPEIKIDRIWIQDQSFSYLAGIAALFEIAPQEVLKLYHQNKLYEKNHYERFVRQININNKLKDIILNLINPNAAMRLSLYEALSKSKDRSADSVSRKLKNKGVQIQCTGALGKYQLQFREISKITDRIVSWKQVEKNMIFTYPPAESFKKILKKSKTLWHVKEEKGSFEDKIVKLLNDKIQNGQIDIAVLIMDKSILQMENNLETVLKKFKKVILFSEQNPFKSASNIKHYSITNFLITINNKGLKK